MPFVQEGSRQVLRQGTGPASCLFVPTLAIGVGLTLVGGKNVLQALDVARGREAFGAGLAAALLAIGVFMVLVAVLAIAGRSEVVIDRAARTVRTELRVGAPLRVRRFRFDDFDRVEVLRGAGRRSPGHGGGYTFYFAALKGRRASVGLERMSLREATAQAHEVARWLGVHLVPCRDP
jgi:hypothetical protein